MSYEWMGSLMVPSLKDKSCNQWTMTKWLKFFLNNNHKEETNIFKLIFQKCLKTFTQYYLVGFIFFTLYMQSDIRNTFLCYHKKQAVLTRFMYTFLKKRKPFKR